MVKIASEEMKCMQAVDMVLTDILPDDAFLNEFGAWPDQAFCLSCEEGKNGRLLQRGTFLMGVGEELGGVRTATFTDMIDTVFVGNQ
jgi:hypothetical protein